MKRFFVEKADVPVMRLTGAENRHLSEVLRAKPGENIIICPNDGFDYVYRIAGFDKTSAELHFVSKNENDTEAKVRVTVYFSMLKGDKSEYVVQKMTELGVVGINPFLSEFTVSRPEKSDRLKRAAHEAAKQCGRAIIPNVGNIISFDEMLKEIQKHEIVLFAYESRELDSLAIATALNGKEGDVAVIIGPEGGFSETEAEKLTACTNVKKITLGKRILRADTAAVAVVSAVMMLEGEWE